MNALKLFSLILPFSLLLSAPNVAAASKPEAKAVAAPSSAVTEVKTKKELNTTIGKHKASAIKFGSEGHAAFEKVAAQHKGSITALSADASNPQLKDFVSMLDIEDAPTVVYVRRDVGSGSEDTFKRAFSDVTGKAASQAAQATKSADSKSPSTVTEVKTKKELNDHLAKNKVSVIKVGADWCGACTMAHAPFEKIAAQHHGNIAAFSINADNPEFKQFMSTFNIEGLPTFVYIRKDAGAHDEESLKRAFSGVTGKTSRQAAAYAPAQPAPKAKAKAKAVVAADDSQGSSRSRRSRRSRKSLQDLGFPVVTDDKN